MFMISVLWLRIHNIMYCCLAVQELLVLSHTLSGELDGCGLRQLLLLAGLVELMPWDSLNEFSSFASILYPSLQVCLINITVHRYISILLLSLSSPLPISPQEEEIDLLNMNFVSFSGNKISAQLVLDFLTWQLMRQKDPLLLHVSNTVTNKES